MAVGLEELREKQESLKEKLVLEDALAERITTVGGADVAYSRGKALSACVVLDYENLEEVDVKTVALKVTFPYISGYLAFREAEPIVKAFRKLEEKPDILILDGHGAAHPRGFGLACHVGVLLDVPTIGVAKRKMKGCDNCVELAPRVLVSQGHKITLARAVEIIRHCIKNKKPEPIRLAHLKAVALSRA